MNASTTAEATKSPPRSKPAPLLNIRPHQAGYLPRMLLAYLAVDLMLLLQRLLPEPCPRSNSCKMDVPTAAEAERCHYPRRVLDRSWNFWVLVGSREIREATRSGPSPVALAMNQAFVTDNNYSPCLRARIRNRAWRMGAPMAPFWAKVNLHLDSRLRSCE